MSDRLFLPHPPFLQPTRRRFLAGAAAMAAWATFGPKARADGGTNGKAHALAMHGEPKYGPDFKHFDYVNPDAPKGGQLRMSVPNSTTFESFNPFIVRGAPAAGSDGIYESLTVASNDEAFTQYGLLAQYIETPDDRSWVEFTLNPAARWWDGTAITPADVIFTLETLRAKGKPFYRFYYRSVAKVEQTGDLGVRFTFVPGDNRELPLIIGQMSVLCKAYWETRDFEKPSLDLPMGSGAYRITAFEPGRFVVTTRVQDYWGRDLPVNVGTGNWDSVRYIYYKDETVALEGLKAGDFDIRQERSAKIWATGYDARPVRDGRIVREQIPNEIPTGMQCFPFNIRRPIFQDRRVRQALGYAFDFEWSNKALFFGQYTRNASYFSNTELASSGLPQGEELAILEKYRGKVPDEVFTSVYEPPKTKGDGDIRDNLLKARALLQASGWVIRNERLVKQETGEPFQFEFLLFDPMFERIVLPFLRNLRRLGIVTTLRTVGVAEYQNRTDNFDFDMISGGFGQSLSPGNEQADYWGSASADQPGGQNIIGIKDPVIDELVDLLIASPDRESLIQRTRALDRVLLWGFYVIPNWHLRSWRVAYWNKFSRPAIAPKYDLGLDTWWIDPAKAAALAGEQAS
ncbi:MAG TPA: extracellular solute-binding protein [Hypericibacter adhaerens]|uniref:ABC transporter n=1 Tax=Hypericibacter adhaerens TaxID=2602016 RepID=A0A5J6MTB6_9PROT|nr:extracellular solute-binding protein [Hypericibacter adhaerens]QEX20543.1 ABC transporter [Hypericibacter adhaerens]HWA44406.1 extracellular solute-binding protein [Hypericibacter adhaerens]